MEKHPTDYEEKEVICIGCGKIIKTIILKGRKIKNFLCQKCGKI